MYIYRKVSKLGISTENDRFLSWVEYRGCRYSIVQKLKVVKKVLKIKNKEVYGGIKQRVMQAKERLDEAQRMVLSTFRKAAAVRKENECHHEYLSISKADEAFLKQKSRNQWLNLGEQNNSYFHWIVKVQNSKNVITHLWDVQGRRVEDVEQIRSIAVDYYQKLLGTSNQIFDNSKAAIIQFDE